MLGPGVRLLLVGINPGLRSAAMGHHFAGPGNRFWAALHTAGITPRRLLPDEQHLLIGFGVGITNLVSRPSARADVISTAELRDGVGRLDDLVARAKPEVVAVLGVTAYRQAMAAPKARPGPQDARLGGARLWLLPNPSGLNASTLPAAHAAGLREAAVAAGLPLHG